jgi:serine protease Do
MIISSSANKTGPTMPKFPAARGTGLVMLAVCGHLARRAFVFCLALAVSFVSASRGQDTANLEDLEQKAFRAAVDRVADCVVRIETVGGLERVSNVLFGTGPTTGVIVDADGYIVSSAFNFLNKPTSILVRLPDGSRKPAELVATDSNRMIVLLKVRADGPLPTAEVAPEKEMRVGQWALAVGRTFESERPNMTVGVVSALGRIWGKAIQTDAILSPNNYGGALIDIRGRAMGIIVPLSPESAEEVAGVEWYDSGIGFAIPLEFIQTLLPRLKKGDLKPGVIGISLSGNVQTDDAALAAVQPGSPAAEAGLKQGDKIVEINGQPVARAADLKREIARHYAGDTLRLVALRGQERVERQIVMIEKLEPFQHAFLGVLPMRGTSREGTRVRFVYPGSPAEAAGIKAGDVIAAVGGKALKGRNELREEIGVQKIDEEIEIEVRQGDKANKLKVRLQALPESAPPASLPEARERRDYQGERPKTGRLTLKVPEMANEAAVYVPAALDPDVPHGLIVWMHGVGGFDQDQLFSRFEQLCNKHDLILVAPKAADPQKWAAADMAFIQKLLEQVTSSYDIDGMRTGVYGHDVGAGSMAWMMALRNRDTIRSVAVVNAPAVGRPPESDPLHRFAVYLMTAQKSGIARQIDQTVKMLREARVPVTVHSLGDEVRPPTDEEIGGRVRWLDMLDRI